MMKKIGLGSIVSSEAGLISTFYDLSKPVTVEGKQTHQNLSMTIQFPPKILGFYDPSRSADGIGKLPRT
jgi:hypothetical protein